MNTYQGKDYIGFSYPPYDNIIEIDITNSENKKEIFDKIRELPQHKDGGNDFGGIRVWFWGGGVLLPESKKK